MLENIAGTSNIPEICIAILNFWDVGVGTRRLIYSHSFKLAFKYKVNFALFLKTGGCILLYLFLLPFYSPHQC